MKDINYIRENVKELLRTKRWIHSMNVEKESVKLGEIYGEDIEKCRIASITHDCVKNFTDEKLFEYAALKGYETDEIEKNSPQLLHGPLGALYIKDKFEIYDRDILNAVEFHTTGRANMSLLEKIIYIADIIEEGRDFDGVNEIRELAYKDIDRALLKSCDKTLEYIIKRGLLIHPRTIEMRNHFVLRGV